MNGDSTCTAGRKEPTGEATTARMLCSHCSHLCQCPHRLQVPTLIQRARPLVVLLRSHEWVIRVSLGINQRQQRSIKALRIRQGNPSGGGGSCEREHA